MDIILSIISILQSLIPCLIWGLFIWGIYCLLLSFWRIHIEDRGLSDIWSDWSSRLTIKEITKMAEQLDERAKKSPKPPNHLGLRIKALLKAVDQPQEHTQSNSLHTKPSLPSLSDLHELTLHNETSQNSTASMNTIISGLLIFGILGTLVGVHTVIEKVDIGALSDALKPSQYAVGVTIILIILRGFYLATVNRYVSRLDRFTMEHLMPIFRPQESTTHSAADKHQSVSERIEAFMQDADAVGKEATILKDEQLKAILDIAARTNSALQTVEGKSNELPAAIPSVPQEVQEVPRPDEKLFHRVKEQPTRLSSKVADLKLKLNQTEFAKIAS